MPTTFTQFLLQHEYASLAELEEASQATVLYGGRLGSALIELGILAPEQLDAALARFHRLPEIPKEWLARPDAAARAALHLDLIKRHRAFPLNFEKRSLHVGMVDPRNEEVLDSLAFASGCLIVPYALAEYRFAELMQRVFAVQPTARFRTLLDDGARARAMRGREQQRKRIAEESARTETSLEIGPLAADVELTDGDAFFVAGTTAEKRNATAGAAWPAQASSARADAAAAAPPLPASAQPGIEIDDTPLLLDRRAPLPSLESLEHTLATCEDRARVIEGSIALAVRFAEVAALFVIRDGVAAGLAAQRGAIELDIDATLIPLASESALARCVASREPVRALPSSALDKRLAKALRAEEQAELAVYPISIGERVVNLLVALPLRGALAATSAAALAALTPQIGAAYGRLIRVQKQKAQEPAAEPVRAAKSPVKTAIGALPLQKRVVRVPK